MFKTMKLLVGIYHGEITFLPSEFSKMALIECLRSIEKKVKYLVKNSGIVSMTMLQLSSKLLK